MNKQQYKITLITALFFSTLLYAQKFDKKYNEEFNTTSNVIIDVDTRHTDIEIETWNKNTVSIEAMIIIEGTDKEKADEIIKNWKFKALGNKNKIEISSKTSGLFTNRTVYRNGDVLAIGEGNFDFVFPEVSVGNLGILDSFEVVMPDMDAFPEIFVAPEVNSFHFNFDMPEFDYEKYKDDKDYMKKWQEEMKKNLEKMQIELKEKSIRNKERLAQRKEELKARQEKRKKEYEKRIKERKAKDKKRMEEHKKAMKLKREVYEKRREELAKNRVLIKNVLADRDKIKIKRIIKIKAPKDAKFNMNVRYGSMSFPN